jgi:hypothetical protein
VAGLIVPSALRAQGKPGAARLTAPITRTCEASGGEGLYWWLTALSALAQSQADRAVAITPCYPGQPMLPTHPLSRPTARALCSGAYHRSVTPPLHQQARPQTVGENWCVYGYTP